MTQDPDRGASGVYRLDVGNFYYIGSSINLSGRRCNHRTRLANNKHPNYRLQAEYNRTGTYTFTVLEYTTPELVRQLEQQYLDTHYHKARCANLEPDATAWKPRRYTRK